MKRFIITTFSAFALLTGLQAQELNANLTVNTSRIQTVDAELFKDLERNVNQMLNEQKWTEATFSKRERIDCTVMISIAEKISEDSYAADIQFTTRRPVYNSSYITTLLNFKDTQFEFNYMLGQSLDINNTAIDNNMVAVISFYVYVIIGLDFDSFSLNGGKPYFTKAMEIANMAQGLNTKGWEPFSMKNVSRYDLAVALSDDSFAVFHNLWYNYHRMGLDEMAANSSRARIRILELLTDLKKIYDTRPSSPLLTIFSEAKLDELVRICSKATAEEKQEARKLLLQIYPAKSDIINLLK